MPCGRTAVRQQTRCQCGAIHNADAFLLCHRQQVEELRIVKTIMIVYQRSIDIEGREDSFPKVHRIDAETDISYPALSLQFLKWIIADRKSGGKGKRVDV